MQGETASRLRKWFLNRRQRPKKPKNRETAKKPAKRSKQSKRSKRSKRSVSEEEEEEEEVSNSQDADVILEITDTVSSRGRKRKATSFL
eukprot:COSAG01_NODE_14308_length_1470_cov_23.158279_2_plen_89_part_00